MKLGRSFPIPTPSLKEQVTEEAYKTLRALENNFNTLFDAGTTDEERDNVRHTLVAARDAYWKAERENLEDDNEFVKGLLAELKTANKEIQKKLRNLQDAVAMIKLFGEAVKLIASITTLAAL